MTRAAMAVLFFLGACAHSPRPAKGTRVDDAGLLGTWRLAIFEQWDSTGRRHLPFGSSPSGYALVDGTGHVFVSLMRPPSSSAVSAASPNAEESRTAANTFVGIYGTYTVNEARSVLRIQVEGTNYAPYVGTVQERQYELRDDTLFVGIRGQYLETFIRLRGNR